MIDFGLITTIVWIVILLALVFDFFNGVNDAANSIATVVATRALPPVAAVAMAAIFNFVGAFLGTEVAKTVGEKIIDIAIIDTAVIMATVIGGLAWTATASRYGIPISVSHALLGGLAGAGFTKLAFEAGSAQDGLAAVLWPTQEEVLRTLEVMFTGAAIGTMILLVLAVVVSAQRVGPAILAGVVFGSSAALVSSILSGTLALSKVWGTVLFIFYAPLVSFVLSYIFVVLLMWLVHRIPPGKTARWFRWLQLVSASAFSLGHGTNDAQKTMGIITSLLVVNAVISDFRVPWEVIVAAASAIALGTLIGGYKVVRTMGHRLTHLEPYQGFSAETAGALNLFFLAENGVPASTTHTIAGGIMGVGATKSVYAVSWGLARNIMAAWVITIPTSATVAAAAYWLITRLGVA